MNVENNYEILNIKFKNFAKEYNTDVDDILKVIEIDEIIIKNAKNLDVLATAIAYLYSQKKNLNLKLKDIAKNFNVKSSSVSQKASAIRNQNREFFDGKYIFVDKNRYKVQQKYYDFLESKESEDIKKSIKILKSLIKMDPNFFDTYITLAEYYYLNGDISKAEEVITEGYVRAMKLVMKGIYFPDELDWLWFENRHIIRMIFHYGMLLWEKGKKENAIEIFTKLLKSNIKDNIGARYAIAGILDGFEAMEEMEEKFASKYGFIDAIKQEEWFKKVVKKYPEYFDWWLKAIEEYEKE